MKIRLQSLLVVVAVMVACSAWTFAADSGADLQGEVCKLPWSRWER